jgi:uncharacterized protein
MIDAMHLSSIWQYPVKSMIGGEVSSAALHPLGLRGDRAWAVRDEVRGSVQGARRIGGLMRLSASPTADGGVSITLPNGSVVHSGDDDVNERLSAALNHPVTLWPLQSADNLDYYRRGAGDGDDMLADLRGIFGREDDEPLPDFSVFPPSIMEFESPPGSHVDAYPLMLMSTSSLRSMAEALPDSNPDVRRFRPNLVIDTGDAPGHPEFDWVGRELRVGDTRLQITAGCPRCVMITREVDADIPTDRAILRHVVRDLNQNVGVYATVIDGGPITVGDSVTVS